MNQSSGVALQSGFAFLVKQSAQGFALPSLCVRGRRSLSVIVDQECGTRRRVTVVKGERSIKTNPFGVRLNISLVDLHYSHEFFIGDPIVKHRRRRRHRDQSTPTE